ncbi:MAG: Cd(II)/Pb(II)-responsive transcriptional regulator [Oceanospirillaceae bacterium]
MKIGELAKKLNCTVETIRYYEKIGLIPASIRDQNNNYRHYNQSHIEKLTFVRHCRALAMSHEEILELQKARAQSGQSCHEIDKVIDNHLLHVSSRIIELQALEEQLLALRKQCLTPGSNENCGIIQGLDTPLIESLSIDKKVSHVTGSH